MPSRRPAHVRRSGVAVYNPYTAERAWNSMEPKRNRRRSFVSKLQLGERRLDVAEFTTANRAIGAGPHEIIRSAEADKRCVQ